MSKLNKFREIERQIAEQIETLEAMKRDKDLQKDMEFEEMLKELMKEYSIDTPRLLSIIDPTFSAITAQQQPARTRRPRALKIYTNPKTGERIETKGGNHKGLKAWKEEFGSEEVETWAVAA